LIVPGRSATSAAREHDFPKTIRISSPFDKLRVRKSTKPLILVRTLTLRTVER
jgi:hypothetical protein